MSDIRPKRSNIVEQLLQKPRYEPEVEDAIDSYAEARTQSRDAAMLDLKLLNGTIVSFAYAYLTRVRFAPGDSIELRFGHDQVKITGKHLGRLRETISEHRTRFVQEGAIGEEGLKPANAAHVDMIAITEGEDV